MSNAQREDARRVFEGIGGGGLLDFVAAWYVKAAQYMAASSRDPQGRGDPEQSNWIASASAAPRNDRIRAAFVSTNSITQGEQVGALWGWLLAHGVHIDFAHRTFQWSNEARGMAAVHCVIIGFGLQDKEGKIIFEYEDIKGEPHAVPARNINPYLVDAPDVALPRRTKSICDVPEIGIGNKPIDGGHYLFAVEERDEFLRREPRAAQWFRRWIGSDEFLNGYERWCLWLGDCPPDQLRKLPEVLKRVEAVRLFRLGEGPNSKGKKPDKSPPESTRKLADTPTRFHVENMPDSTFLVIPEVSSERRNYIPIGFMQPDTLCSNLVKIVAHATLYHFGILCSTMHNAWVRYTCGRLESRYRYSGKIVYNNFPWPEALTRPTATLSPRERGMLETIEAAAQAVLDARAMFLASPSGRGRATSVGEGERGSKATSATLADLYDPLTMPPTLLKAHQKLDAAVDKAYGKTSFKNDAERVAFLFERYQALTSLLPIVSAKRSRKRPAAT